MAHNDSGAASWARFTTASEDPDADLTGPTLFPHGPFQQQLPPMYQNRHMLGGNPPASLVPGSNNPPINVSLVPSSSYPARGSALPSMGNNRQHFPPSANPYPIVPSQRPSSAWYGFGQPYPGQAFHNTGVPLQGYPSFAEPSVFNPPLAGSFNTRSSYHPPRDDSRASVGPTTRNARVDTVPGHPGRHRGPLPGARARDARPPPQAPSRTGEQTWFGIGPPPPFPGAGPGRRSDRSTSPRASNRRNFERYSVDLSQSSTSSDAEEAAARAPPLNRMRQRPREAQPRYLGRHVHVDPNVATARQIQELKHSLQRRLPSALPDNASRACDICQKDYATALVPPTEEEENAAELSCGHIFGEFCIGQWFDTCRTHKNKVTCPMCRKQLIEAPRWIQPIVHASARGQAFIHLLNREHELLAREQMQLHGFQSHFYQS